MIGAMIFGLIFGAALEWSGFYYDNPHFWVLLTLACVYGTFQRAAGER